MRRALIGDVELELLEDEDVDDSAEVTEYTVEDGSTFYDHYETLPSTITLTGLFASHESADSLHKLKNFMRNKELVNYVGRNIYNNMAITSIQRIHNGDNQFGFAYSITLQEVPITQAQRVEISVVNPKTKKVDKKVIKTVKSVSKKGKQAPKKKISIANSKQRKKAYDKVTQMTNVSGGGTR